MGRNGDEVEKGEYSKFYRERTSSWHGLWILIAVNRGKILVQLDSRLYISNIHSVRRVNQPLDNYENEEKHMSPQTQLKEETNDGNTSKQQAQKPQQLHAMKLRSNRKQPDLFRFFLPSVPFRSYKGLAPKEETVVGRKGSYDSSPVIRMSKEAQQ